MSTYLRCHCPCGRPATSYYGGPVCDRCREFEHRLDYDFHTHARRIVHEREELIMTENQIMSIKIVAFLQNPWFKLGTEERIIHLYRDDQEFHRRILASCMTGQRLMTAFGDLYDTIWWDNTNWRPSWHSAGKVFPDFDHIKKVLEEVKPNIILHFGNQARDAVDAVTMGLAYQKLYCHHPNARHQTVQDLCDFAATVRAKILELEMIGQDPPLDLDDAMSLEGRNMGLHKKI